MNILDVRGRERAARAEWILNLSELIALVRPGRRYCTPEEWIRVCARGRDWTDAAARWSIFSLKRKLLHLYCSSSCETRKNDVEAAMRVRRCTCGAEARKGILLEVDTPQDNVGENRGLLPARIYVDTPAIAALVDEYELAAREIDEQLRAKREGRAPDTSVFDEARGLLDPALVVRDYRRRTLHLGQLSRKYGVSQRRIREVLVGARQSIRARRRLRVEEKASPELVAKALHAREKGASLSRVAAILAPCSRRSAARFLARHGLLGPRPTDRPEDRVHDGDRLPPRLDRGAGELGAGPRGAALAGLGRRLANRLVGLLLLRRRRLLGFAPAA